MDILRTKTIEDSVAQTDEPEHRLRRALGAWDLTVFGVGVTVGAGIFVLTGRAAGLLAGPSVALSFLLASIACALAGLCYAEFASAVPVAGSAYTFGYATLGEIIAWIIGWDLILELALGASTVAVGWSQYFHDLAAEFGVQLPIWLYNQDPTPVRPNLIAGVIVLLMTAVLCAGIRLSSRVNAAIVAVKVAIVLLVVFAGLFFVKLANWSPFVPASGSPAARGEQPPVSLLQDLGVGIGSFGWSGIAAAAGLVFFAFIGFDVVATAAEETRNPQRDVPRGILGSLAVVTVLYVAVSLVVTGMVKYDRLSTEAPLAQAFRSVGQPTFATIVSIGALAGLTTVMMILMLGQSRVFFAMSRDHLLPPLFSKVNERTHAPVRVTVSTGVVVAGIASLVPLGELAELVNIGTLFAFVIVAAAVLVLRRTRPELQRAFRVPWVPAIPVLSILASVYLMLNLPTLTWLRFVLWMAIGLVVYFAYGAGHSRLATGRPETGRPDDTAP